MVYFLSGIFWILSSQCSNSFLVMKKRPSIWMLGKFFCRNRRYVLSLPRPNACCTSATVNRYFSIKHSSFHLATKTPKETAAIQSFFKYKHYGILDKRKKWQRLRAMLLAISAIDIYIFQIQPTMVPSP